MIHANLHSTCIVSSVRNARPDVSHEYGRIRCTHEFHDLRYAICVCVRAYKVYVCGGMHAVIYFWVYTPTHMCCRVVMMFEVTD